LTSGLALPAMRVPSIETTPRLTSPARSHSLSTSPNRSDNARSRTDPFARQPPSLASVLEADPDALVPNAKR
jgi:hypothetical protein